MKFITYSSQETKEVAKDLAQKCHQGVILALYGDLGAGKTTFTQGFAEGLKIQDKIISPTFTLIKEYPLSDQLNGKFYHIDLYRLDSIQMVEQLGVLELFDNPHNIVIIEWAEKLGNLLPAKTLKIHFQILDNTSREIDIE